MRFYEELVKGGVKAGKYNETTKSNDQKLFNFNSDWEKYRVAHWGGSTNVYRYDDALFHLSTQTRNRDTPGGK